MSNTLACCLCTAAHCIPLLALRIIRPPRKRGGHVILDVCAAAAAPTDNAADSSIPSSSQPAAAGLPPAGRLERHVIAKSDARKWMGRAAYSMARDAQWGDLWCWRSRIASVNK
jgi:ribosomal protein RSM22 (predicted rRNA methylase)